MDLPFQHYLETLHRRLSVLSDGQVASYIPELAKADPAAFGICVVTTDGYAYAVGDCDRAFTIQSISKPFIYATALADRGREFVRSKVGVEPSGDAFNSISLNPQTGAPVNPMINAGAIAATGLVAGDDAEAQWTRIISALSAFAGRALTVDRAVYESESATGFRNRAIAWMLRNFDISRGDPMPALENYFRQCAVEVTCRDLAFMAATLANGGIHPASSERVAAPDVVESVLSVMSTCGMYDYAGSWLYEVGMPAKSGVGGGIIAVLPGQFGIGVFSPPLDSIGNSVRGIAACREISRDFGLHVFGAGHTAALALNRVYSAVDAPARRVLPDAAAETLAANADQIRYLALQGELTLDGAERVSRKVAELSAERNNGTLPGVRYFILDLRRVTGLSSSAGLLLRECARRLLAERRHLVLSRAGSLEIPAEIACFADNDQAVEWCENHLLTTLGINVDNHALEHIADFPLFNGLDKDSLVLLETRLERREWHAGELLMRVGDADDDRLFLVLSGELSILLPHSAGGEQRLAALGVGDVAGEMVLLGQMARTATVRAERTTVCLSLRRGAFEQLAAERTWIKITVLDNLARELARKLAQANRLIGALAS